MSRLASLQVPSNSKLDYSFSGRAPSVTLSWSGVSVSKNLHVTFNEGEITTEVNAWVDTTVGDAENYGFTHDELGDDQPVRLWNTEIVGSVSSMEDVPQLIRDSKKKADELEVSGGELSMIEKDASTPVR